MITTLETTAESAILKIAKLGNWMKSTTWPMAKEGSRNRRSVRFPSAPPSSRPSASDHQTDPKLAHLEQDHH